MGDYQEIFRLKDMLEKEGVPFEIRPLCGGFQIGYPSVELFRKTCSVIEHDYSYGSVADKLEIMGLLTPAELKCDGVVGWLTAEEVFERIKTHWIKNKGEE